MFSKGAVIPANAGISLNLMIQETPAGVYPCEYRDRSDNKQYDNFYRLTFTLLFTTDFLNPRQICLINVIFVLIISKFHILPHTAAWTSKLLHGQLEWLYHP